MASMKLFVILTVCVMLSHPGAEANAFTDLVEKVTHKIVKILSEPEFKEHFEFVNHQCKASVDFKIKLGEFDHDVSLTCPDWSIDSKGNAGTKFEAVSEAARGLLHEAINQKQVITHEEVHAWTKR